MFAALSASDLLNSEGGGSMQRKKKMKKKPTNEFLWMSVKLKWRRAVLCGGSTS